MTHDTNTSITNQSYWVSVFYYFENAGHLFMTSAKKCGKLEGQKNTPYPKTNCNYMLKIS